MGRIVKSGCASSTPRRVSHEQDRAAVDLVAARAAAAKIRFQAKEELIDLSLEIAKKIVGHAIEIDASAIDSIYERAFSAAREMERASVSVHPEDRANSGIDELARAHAFEIVEDVAVGRGGCRVTAGGVEVDARLESILGALSDAMKGTVVV